MRRLSLTIAAFASMVSVPILLGMGISALFSQSFLIGLLMICVGIPVAIAHAVVYDYVGERMDIARREAEITSAAGDMDSPTKGTPWESDPGHTTE